MKKYLFLILYLQLTFAQNNLEIQYAIKYNTAFYNEKIGTLQIDLKNQTSLFNISKNIVTGKVKEKIDDPNQINIVKKETLNRYIFNDFKLDTLVFNENIHNVDYTIKEQIPKFQWVLATDSIKKIGEINCFMATTSFRGRKFVAWYTEDYPIKMGPWKFSGLPGLIVEVYDETMRFYWCVTSIKTIDKPTISIQKSTKNIIDIKKYVNIIYDPEQQLMLSDLPRGVKVENNKIPRTWIEVKFEWEK